MDRPKPDTTLAFSFAEPSVALHALLGQGTTAKPQSKEPKESKTARIVPSMTYDSDSSNPAYIRRNDFLDEVRKFHFPFRDLDNTELTCLVHCEE